MSGFANFLKKGYRVFRQEIFYRRFGLYGSRAFSTLIIGLIIETPGSRPQTFSAKPGVGYFVELGGVAKSLMGAGIGIAVSYGLKVPPLSRFAARLPA